MEARELFDICHELATGEPTGSGVRRMHELLVLTCSEGRQAAGGTYGNLFSQVDRLCETLGIAADDKIAIQTARRHSNSCQGMDREDWLYDLRAISLFISAVFREDVPGKLLKVLPATNRPRQKGLSINKDCVRCIVRRYDDTTIFADTEGGEVVIDYGSTEQGRDLGYLRKILREGMQLNLLDCHVEQSHITPQVIVVEPDLLIDVSSLAACFTGYGHHPLLYTVNRLKPRTNTQAMLLGNFAGTALDDIIGTGSREKGTIMKDSLRRSFREQAMRFCACEDFSPEQFKADAEEQISNICEAVEELREKFSAKSQEGQNAILEPSFVCERLGLQGRVDLMTTDMHLLVEQKSGRNMKIERQSHDSHGLQREDHYVQLLLYYGILRYNFGKTERQVDTRLLYSHYPASQGLLQVNYYRTLFREAIKLRNQIVAIEFLIAREGFGRIVPLLTPDVIYKDVTRDAFFHRYVEPELSTLNFKLLTLNSLDSAYLERMMTFVYREQLCHKLGVEEGIGGSTADLWQMPLTEKRETGNIFIGLTITKRERTMKQGGYDLITLNVPDLDDDFLPNFRRGDLVYLYQYHDVPDVRKSILYKGTLQDISPDEMTVRLNNGQQNPTIFVVDNAQTWAVEHGGSDSTTTSQVKGLFQLMTADPRRRSLLLGQRPPEADEHLTLTRAYHPNYDNILLRQKQARDYFLLVGPPGTGKTSMALRFMVEECSRSVEGGVRSDILLMAYTNRAVDEICGMLSETEHDFLRLGNAASCDPRFRKHLLEERLDETAKLDDIRQLIEEIPIIVGTTSILMSRPEIFSLKHFSLAIVDEASQILEPSIIGLLASDHIDRFVLIGDYKQLPAVVQQSEEQARVDEPCLRNIGLTDCRQSLFERLIRWEQANHRTQFIGTLQKQGRMHPEVAQFPDEHFYRQEQLDIVPCKHQQATTLGYRQPAEDDIDTLLQQHRMLFFPVKPSVSGNSDKSNPEEARVVADLLRRLRRFYGEDFDAQSTVGIIVPYRNQIAMIRKAIKELGIPDVEAISIDTVERYQGSQRDVIIYSFTVNRRYQLDFLTSNTFEEDHHPIDRKLNVALTRARKQMLMTGNPDVLAGNLLFRDLINKYNIDRFR